MHHHHYSPTDLVPTHPFEGANPVEVDGTRLRAQHPLVLPTHVCVRCGSREAGGTVHDDWVTYTSPWIWLTLFISWLLTIIAYLVTRKRMQVQYYLCPSCSDKRKIRTVTSGIVTAVSFAGFAFAMIAESLPFMGLFGGVFFVAALARLAWVAPPLRAIAHDNGSFLLKGASPRFLASLETRQLGYEENP